MNHIYLDRVKIVRFMLKILAVFLILDGNSMYHSLAYQDLHLPWICVALILVTTLFTGVTRGSKQVIIIALMIFMYCLTYFIIQYESISKEVYICIIIGFPLLLIMFYNLRLMQMEYELFYCIEWVMLRLSVISLFFWLFGQISGLVHTNMSVVSNWGRIRTWEGYYGLHFATNYSNSLGNGLPINSGLFSEGPMFCLWLCISLATELFLREKYSKPRVALLIITIATTLSTTGVLFVALSFGLKYLEYMKGRVSIWKVVLTFLLILLLPVAVVALQQVIMLKMNTSSYSIRYRDYIAGYLLFREHPIFGSGYGNIMSLQKYVLLSTAGNVGFSNTVTAILGTGGLWNFIIYLASIVIPLGGRGKKDQHIKSFFILYTFLTVFVIFFSRLLMVVFFAFSFSQLNSLVNCSNSKISKY